MCGALLSVWEATSELGMTVEHLRPLYATVLREAEQCWAWPSTR